MLVLYFAHSYRKEDKDIVSYFGKLMESKNITPSLDPPSSEVNSAKLERHMLSTDGMIAVLTKRADGFSPHIYHEILMCIRAKKPLLVFIEDTLPDSIISQNIFQKRFSRGSLIRQMRDHLHAIDQLKGYIGEKPPPKYFFHSGQRSCGIIGASILKENIRSILFKIIRNNGYKPFEIDKYRGKPRSREEVLESSSIFHACIQFVDAKNEDSVYARGVSDATFIPTIQITGNKEYPFPHNTPREYHAKVINLDNLSDIRSCISNQIRLLDEDFLELNDNSAVQKYADLLVEKAQNEGHYAPSTRGTFVREIVMNTTYNANNSTNVTQGPNARSQSISITTNNTVSNDLKILADEIKILRDHIKQGANDDEKKADIELLEKAETLAREGNKEGSLARLKKVGGWVLESAKDIGTEVAKAAIKSSIGL